MKKSGTLGMIGGGLNSAIGSTHIIASQMDHRWSVKAGAFSRDPNVNENTGRHWGIEQKNVFKSWQEMVNHHEDIDAFVVLTPTPTHYEIVSKLLELGKNVICEKALTASSSEALELHNLSVETGSKLLVTFNYTGYPLVRDMKQAIDSGVLGEISSIQVQMPQEGFARIGVDGNPVLPQSWRQEDGSLSTLSLDLGVHLVNLIQFLTKEFPKNLVATKSHHGLVPNVVDYVSCLAETSSGIDIILWYGKSHIGKRNGLEITVTGSKGSFNWVQSDPETLRHSNNLGEIKILDRASPGIQISSQVRYTRFKAGHPAGFIEAFSNHYFDLADSILLNEQNDFVFDALDAAKGLSILESIESSSTERKWVSC